MRRARQSENRTAKAPRPWRCCWRRISAMTAMSMSLMAARKSLSRDKIRTVMDSRPARVGRCGPERPAVPLLLSNAMLERFRVVETEGCMEDGTAILTDRTRRALGVQAGDTVRIAPGQRARAPA